MKRVLPVVLLFFISGVLAGQNLTNNADIVSFFAAAALVAVAFFVYHKKTAMFLFVLIALAGFLNVTLRQNLPAAQTDNARIIKPQGSGFIVETVPGNIKILAYSSDLKNAKPGDMIRLAGSVTALQTARNPGGFDEKMYFAARGVKYKMYAYSAVITGHKNSFGAMLYNIRGRLCAVYDYCLPEKEAGVVKAIVVGDRSDLQDDTADLYSKGGIYHLLAISGLHIGVLCLFLNFVLRRIASKRKAAAFTMGPLIFYCLLTGASASTMRAVIIVCVLYFGQLIYRKNDAITSLSFAALCILIYNPFFLWDIGFRLSFSAVVGIILLSPRIDTLFLFIGAMLPKLKKFFNNFWVKQSLSASTAVSIAILPISTSYTPRIATYAIIINIIILPTFFALAVVSFVMGLLGLVYLPAAVFLAGPVYFLLNIYEGILTFFAQLPFSNILTGHMPLYITVPYYAAVAAGALYLHKLTVGVKPRKIYVCTVSVILLVCVFYHIFIPKPLSVTMLDVGQGDCFVIKKDSFTMVIDGGGWNNVATWENTGVKVLMPYLDYLGVNKVDIALVTHLDYDHATGIMALLDAKRADVLCYPANVPLTWHNTVLRPLSRGDSFEVNGITFTCFNPDKNQLYDGNDGSVVIKMAFKDISFLFTGDITSAAEEVLAREAGIKADVLKLSHHGSKYSNSEVFLSAVSPALAIVSYSKYNNYGLPSDDVTQRLLKMGIPLYETAGRGAVIITTDGTYIKVK